MDRDKINHLKELIATDERFVGRNGRLLINKVQAAAKSYDPDLIALLRGDDQARDMFFQEIGDIVVFEGDKFIWTLDAQDYLEGSYTEYSQNIGLTVGGQRISDSDDVVLEFPYKDCVLEFDSTSEDDDRPEVMMNEVLMKNEIDYLFAPKVLVNAKLHDEEGEHPLDTVADGVNGIIIKGNNLLALHTLLPRYQGKIKLMYWDILYNTDSDQVPYNDSFKHSTWLVMMKNRLEVARSLLSSDGIICLQCDDNEQAYLKVLCDEVFGRSNFVNCIAVKSSEPSGVKMSHTSKKLPKLKDYILIYKIGDIELNDIRADKAKWDEEYKTLITNITPDEVSFIKKVARDTSRTDEDLEKMQALLDVAEYQTLADYFKEHNVPVSQQNAFKYDNAYRIFQCVSMSEGASEAVLRSRSQRKKNIFFYHLTNKGLVYVIKGDYSLDHKKPRMQVLFADEYMTYNPCDLWTDMPTTGLDNEGVVALKNGKKPEALLQRIIELNTSQDDIVLDAYLGSGTTCAVAHKMSRKYIGIEQLDKHFGLANTRLSAVVDGEQGGISKKVNWSGGGAFISCELMKASEQFISRANEAETDAELVAIFNELLETPFVLYRVDIEKARTGFADLELDEKREIIIKVIDKNTLYVNYDDIDNGDYDINDTDKAFTRSFYGDDEVK